MKRTGVKEDSVALASDKKSRLCERCFANVPPTEEFCPECGAAIAHEGASEGSDAAVYPELARANLLRMRGDYKAAEQQCLTILRRYPNNTTANILLGDICAEKGDLEQAIQWYEMALDLAPDSTAAKHKLHSVRQRFKERETVQTVEQLGLPTTRSRAGVYAMALIGSIFVIAVIAYFLGQHVEERKQLNLTKISTKEIPPVIDNGPGGPIPPAPKNPREDDDLLKAIQNAGAEGARVLHATQDPRSRVLTVTYSVLEGEDPRSLGATIAQAAFAAVNEAPIVTLRGMRQGTLAYVADAMRGRYDETLTSTWKTDHQSSSDAWIDHVLTNEWPASGARPAPTPVPTPPPTSTDGGASDTSEPPGDEPPVAADTTTDGGTPIDGKDGEATPATDPHPDAPPGDQPATTGG
jgi:tetratricopeptide (TPR) repeat protein